MEFDEGSHHLLEFKLPRSHLLDSKRSFNSERYHEVEAKIAEQSAHRSVIDRGGEEVRRYPGTKMIQSCKNVYRHAGMFMGVREKKPLSESDSDDEGKRTHEPRPHPHEQASTRAYTHSSQRINERTQTHKISRVSQLPRTLANPRVLKHPTPTFHP